MKTQDKTYLLKESIDDGMHQISYILFKLDILDTLIRQTKHKYSRLLKPSIYL